MRKSAPFQIHVLEGKQLKQVLLRYPDLVTRYFGSDSEKRLREYIQTWLQDGILPGIDLLAVLLPGLPVAQLTPPEVAFVLISAVHTAGRPSLAHPDRELPSLQPFIDRAAALAADAEDATPLATAEMEASGFSFGGLRWLGDEDEDNQAATTRVRIQDGGPARQAEVAALSYRGAEMTVLLEHTSPPRAHFEVGRGGYTMDYPLFARCVEPLRHRAADSARDQAKREVSS